MHSINLYDIHMKFVNDMEYSVSGAVAILGDSIVTNSYILYVGLDSSYRVVPKSGYKSGVISNQIPLNLLVFDNGIVFELYYSASTYQINIGSTFDYLATINNLDTPIEKTSAQTMKITYTLTEA